MTTVLLTREGFGEYWLQDFINKSQEISQLVWKGEAFPEGVTNIIRWGTTSNVPKPSKVFNSAKAIHRISDKAGFRKLMQEGSDKICPLTYFTMDDFYNKPLSFPLVIRPLKHAWGEGLVVVNNFKELTDAIATFTEGWYASEFINKRREYRVMIVQGRIAFVAERPPKVGQVYWGGGGFNNIRWGQWPIEAVKVAIKASALAKADFVAADVLEDQEGRCFVTELNTAPQTMCPYKQEVMAMCFDQMVRDGGAPIMVGGGDNWKDFIHPALDSRAIVPATGEVNAA